MLSKSHQFHQLVQKSGLLSEPELSTITHDTLPAEYLERALLTHYQLQKLQAGQWQNLTLANHELLYPLARGGTSMVYLARQLHQRDGPLRALKVALAPTPGAVSEARLRLLHEGELCQRWTAHPHLANVVHSGANRSTAYLLMRYVPGSTLKQLAQTKLDIPQLCRIFADVALGLDHLHRARVVHRDVKPSNIMVDHAGRGTLIDYGFAYSLDEQYLDPPQAKPGSTVTLGTLKYMAPEQITSPYHAKAAADIYGLGCSLYTKLTGSAPFPGPTPRDIVAGHRHGKITSIRSLRRDVPSELERLTVSMLEKLPEHRPTSALVVAQELARFASAIQPIALDFQTSSQQNAAQIAAVELQWLNRRESGST